MQADFVKGHCGWDVVTLLPAEQIPRGRELEAALKILDAPVDGGLEVGFLGRGNRPDEITVKIVDSTTRNWVRMCGGMTQVIGKAAVESFFRDHFKFDLSTPYLRFKLMTPSGEVPILVEVANGRATRVTTVMDNVIPTFYAAGVTPLTLRNCDVLRVDDFCVIDVASLERAYPGHDFTRRDPGPHLDIVNSVLHAFGEEVPLGSGVVGMMYDQRPQGPGAFRLYPRFLSDDLAAARLPYEFQCGTGLLAVGIALVRRGLLPASEGQECAIFEWGSQSATPDPYGIRTSEFAFSVHEDRLIAASFSHSVVEILAEGRLTLPGY